MALHDREHCPDRLAESFWLPSICPGSTMSSTSRFYQMVDAEAVEWDGISPYQTAHYHCACCGATWTEDDVWPPLWLWGPGWRDHEPGRWVAGVDTPGYTAGDPTRQPAAMAAGAKAKRRLAG
jgi:hypothetical protein